MLSSYLNRQLGTASCSLSLVSRFLRFLGPLSQIQTSFVRQTRLSMRIIYHYLCSLAFLLVDTYKRHRLLLQQSRDISTKPETKRSNILRSRPSIVQWRLMSVASKTKLPITGLRLRLRLRGDKMPFSLTNLPQFPETLIAKLCMA